MNNYKRLINISKKKEIERKEKRKALLDSNGKTEEMFLKDYKPSNYPKPSVTVDNLIFTIKDEKLQVLLIKRKNHPDIDTWALPGGFIECGENGETAEYAAYRELKEETNLENIYMEQLYTWSDVNRDPRMRVMSIAFMALINISGTNIKAGDDAKETAWFEVSKIKNGIDNNGIVSYDLILKNEEFNVKIEAKVFDMPRQNGVLTTYKSNIIQISDEKLAFDHINIVNMGIDRLRNKVEYTPIAFNLLPLKFTLPELQKIYEIILQKKLYKKNFRDKISQMVVDTGEKETNFSRRPAKIYKYNNNN